MVASLLIALSFAGCVAGQPAADDSTTAAIEAQDITENPDTRDKDSQPDAQSENGLPRAIQTGTPVLLADTPAYDGMSYIQLENNMPDFTEEEKKSTEAFERYSDLDSLGRCGQAYANICPELQPAEERGTIGNVRPSGWHTVKYNDLIDGNYLYNRCHLIAYCLAGENANEKNLITGTRYLNVDGMLPFEEKVDAYVKETGNHVLYRVTPIFEGDNLVASGVEMEGWSVEEQTPNSELMGDNKNETAQTYILNTNTKKIHRPTCSSVSQMKEKNKQIYEGTVEELENMGYTPCKKCNP